jgi:hypothetical protein
MPLDSDYLGEPERLQIGLLPLGGAECYLDLRNPEFLKGEFSSKDIPTKVTSYRQESLESLKSIQEVASRRLKNMGELYPSEVDYALYNVGQYVFTAIPDAVISALIYAAFQSSEPVLGTVGLLTAGGVTAGSGLLFRKRKKDYKEKIDKVNANIKKFEATPLENIVVKVDKELEEISGLIEGNLTHHIKPQNVSALSDGTCVWIKKMFSQLGTSIPQYARDIYELKLLSNQQKRLADKGLLRLTDR